MHQSLVPPDEQELLALSKKVTPEALELFRKYDFLTAYAKHTDMRVQDNPKGAVGAIHDWERHGNLQFNFLRVQGLKPHHTLTEIGCGTGRLARKVVPYLNVCGYTGVDLSQDAIEAAQRLAAEEGWADRKPLFLCAGMPPDKPADMLWAFSVFIHLPREVMLWVMRAAAKAMHERSRFLFSYVPEKRDERTGLKQFRHTLETYKKCCLEAGLTFSKAPTWDGEQQIAVAKLAT